MKSENMFIFENIAYGFCFCSQASRMQKPRKNNLNSSNFYSSARNFFIRLNFGLIVGSGVRGGGGGFGGLNPPPEPEKIVVEK